MKQISFVGRVVELWAGTPWSGYGRGVPKGHPPDECPVRINVEVDGALELAAILPPDVAKEVETGSVVKVILAPGTDAELTKYQERDKAE